MKQVAIALIAIFGLVAVAMAAQGPEVISIDKVKKAMAPIEFQHHKHQERVEGKCTTCHHTEKEGETALKACSECHAAAAAEAPSYKDAMHKRCQGCHKEQNASGKSAPVKCNECHKK